LLSPSAPTPGKDILSWVDHSARRQHTGEDDLCEGPEGRLAGRVQGTEVPGWPGSRVGILREAEIQSRDSRIVACLPRGLRLRPCKVTNAVFDESKKQTRVLI